MAQECGFFNAELEGEEYDRVYNAEQFAAYFASFIGNGIFGNSMDEMVVLENTTPNMSVNVASGKAWINGWWYRNTDDYNLSIDVADGVLNRIDTVVLRWGSTERDMWLQVIKGTPATNPTAPAIIRNADYYDLKLCEVSIPAGTVNIRQGQITDTRPISSVCGFVTGVVDQIDATSLFLQFRSQFEAFMRQNDATFDAWYTENTREFNTWVTQQTTLFINWFNEMKGQLSEDAAGHLQQEVDAIVDYSQSTDKTPYQFRRCTHNAVYDKLVGISYVKNQLVQNGNFANGTTGWSGTRSTMSASNGVLTATCTTAGFVTLLTSDAYSFYDLVGRAVLVRLQMKASAIRGTASVALNANTINSNYYRIPASSLTANSWYNVDVVIKPSETPATVFRVGMDSLQVGDTISIQNVNVIDLTAMFGNPAIADKIYTMEQSTAGSGLAWIRQYGFLNGIYEAFNVGTIESSAPTVRKVVGFNQWDEEWESGGIDYNTGNKTQEADRIRSKNFISVLPNKKYFIKDGGHTTALRFYDENKNYISYDAASSTDRIFIPPSNCRYLKIIILVTTYNHDICINISDTTKNGTYEPYKEVTYPLGGDTLRGVPKLVGNDLVADGDIKTSDGVINKRYAKVDLGTLNWIANSTHEHGFSCESLNIASGVVSMICSGMSIYGDRFNWTVFDSMPDRCLAKTTNTILYAKDLSCTTAAQFKTAMSGVYLVYEKATPTSSVSTPFISPQVSLETEETDTICGHDSVVVDIPEWMQNEYFDDVRAEAGKLYGILDTKVTNMVKVQTLDLNDVTDGVVYVDGQSPNAPTANSYAVLTFGTINGSRGQFAIAMGFEGYAYIRKRNYQGVWGEWFKMQMQNDTALQTTNKTVVGAINEVNTALGGKKIVVCPEAQRGSDPNTLYFCY